MNKKNTKLESSPVGTPIFSFVYKHLFNIESLALSGEAIKDIVVNLFVISFLINNVLLKFVAVQNEIYILSISFAIMLVPMSMTVKWLKIIFGEKNKQKENSK